MLNCLRSDFFKAFKGRTFLVVTIVAAGYALITVGVFALLNGILRSENVSVLDGKSIVLAGLMDTTPAVLTGIFTAIFICSEYSYGTMRNLVSKSVSRTKIFFSKFIVCCIVSVILFLIFNFIVSALGLLFYGYGGSFTGGEFLEILSKLFVILFINICFVSIFTFFSFLTRFVGGALSVNLVIVFILPSIIMMLTLAPGLDFMNDIWLGNLLGQIASSSWSGNLTTHPFLTLLSGDTFNFNGSILNFNNVILRVMLTSLAYIVVPIVFAYTLFIKQDIK